MKRVKQRKKRLTPRQKEIARINRDICCFRGRLSEYQGEMLLVRNRNDAFHHRVAGLYEQVAELKKAIVDLLVTRELVDLLQRNQRVLEQYVVRLQRDSEGSAQG